jgi:arylsulfatase A-like enzyme
MKGSTYEGGFRVPCIARWPGKIPAGHENHAPAVMMDLFTTVLTAAGIELPGDRVIDGRDMMPLFTGDAASPHKAVFGQQGERLATVRTDRWKLHLTAPRDNFAALNQPGKPWIDPRGPDGVTILAPHEQYQPSDHPGILTGDAPKAMQLFDLQADPGEQTDVAAQHPVIVAELQSLSEELKREVPAAK